MNPKRSMKKIQMVEKTMEVFGPWKKAKIRFDAESRGLDGALFLPCAGESILIYYIQYNILYLSTLGEI